MIRRTLWCLGLVFAVVHVALADQIVLKNGDRITGSIVKSDGKVLTLKSDYGDLSVKLDSIEQLTSTDPLYLVTNDGKTVVGKVAANENQVAVTPKDGSKVEFARSSVAVIRSSSEQAAYERLLKPGWFDLWGGYVDLGYSLTTGNTDTSSVALASNISRITRRDKTQLYLAFINSKNNATGETVTTANALRFGGRYDFKLKPRLSAFGFADFEHNEIQLLDIRGVFGGGLGYDIIATEKTSLQAFGGAAYNHESFSTGLTRNSAELLAGEELNYKASSRTKFFERFTVYPNISDGGEYRITFDAGLSTKLTRYIDWQLTVSDRYISNPVPGSKGNDLLLTTGLRFSFQQ